MKTLKKSILLLTSLVMAMSLASCVNDGLTEEPAAGAGKVAALDEQAASIEATVEDLNALQSAAEGNETALDEAVNALETHIADLRSGASLMEGTMATFAMQKKIAGVIGAIEASDEEGTLKKQISNLEKGISAWAGKNFDAYYPAAKAEAVAAARLAGLNLKTQKIRVEAILSDVEAGLRKIADKDELTGLAAAVNGNMESAEELVASLSATAAEVEEEYAQAVETAVTDPEKFDLPALKQFNSAVASTLAEADNTLAGLIARVEACETQLDDIKARLESLESKVDDLKELLGMIQSVTFMSEYSEEEAVAYYTLSTERVSSGNVCKRDAAESLTVNYLVRPASAAAALAEEALWNSDSGLRMMYYYADVATKAPNTFYFTITDVVVTDKDLGLVTVTVTNSLKEDFFLKQTGAKLALSVKTGKTDLTTKFVEIIPVDDSGRTYVESLTFDKTYVEVDDGQTAQITATVSPSGAYDKTLVWNSNNTDVVTVSSTGLLTAKSVGTATITATTKGTDEWGNTLTATCNVKVLSKIKLIGSSSVAVGGTIELRVESPDYLDPESVSWTSSNTSKATVGATGTTVTVTAIANTYSQSDKTYSPISITCNASGNILTHELYVVETQPQYLTWNTLGDASSKTVKIGQELDMSASIYPTSVSSDYFKVIYQVLGTGDANIATVDYSTGKVTAEGAGTLTFFARAYDADSQYSYFYPSGNLIRKFLEVTVEPIHLTKIDVTQSLELTPGSSAQLAVTLTSDTDGCSPTYPGLTYSSSSESTATVDQSGNVTGIKAGTAVITVSSTQYPDISATCTVNVTEEWLDFEVGDYVIRKSDGTIAFLSGTAKNTSLGRGSITLEDGTIVGVVIYKGNPKATDVALPDCCIHGIAIGLNESGDATLCSNSATSLLSTYYSSNSSSWSDPSLQSACLGYNNTQMLKAAVAANNYTSEVLVALADYESSNTRPTDTSPWYLPSVYEAKLIHNQFSSNYYKDSNDQWITFPALYYAGGNYYGDFTYATTYYHWMLSGNTYRYRVTATTFSTSSTTMMTTDKTRANYLFAF